jgi:exosome complex RNA-binding protein Csl4
MTVRRSAAPARAAALATLLAATLGACSNLGSLGNVLGGVLGGGGDQVSGTIEGVDTRAQQIFLQQSNGQTVTLAYDNQTQVVYQNQNYPVQALERGDQVTARVQSTNNGGYYTDLVQVDQSVSGSTSGSGSDAVQSFQGTVRQVDRASGRFTLDVNNYGTLLVSMPYNPSRSDVNTFQNLRSGDYVRLYGVLLNSSRVELRQFY